MLSPPLRHPHLPRPALPLDLRPRAPRIALCQMLWPRRRWAVQRCQNRSCATVRTADRFEKNNKHIKCLNNCGWSWVWLVVFRRLTLVRRSTPTGVSTQQSRLATLQTLDSRTPPDRDPPTREKAHPRAVPRPFPEKPRPLEMCTVLRGAECRLLGLRATSQPWVAGRSSRAGCVESEWKLSSSDITVLELFLNDCCNVSEFSTKWRAATHIWNHIANKKEKTAPLPHIAPPPLPADPPPPPPRPVASTAPAYRLSPTPQHHAPAHHSLPVMPATYQQNIRHAAPAHNPATQRPQSTAAATWPPTQFRFLPKHALMNTCTPFTYLFILKHSFK